MAQFKCKKCSAVFEDDVKGLVYCPNCVEIQPIPENIDEETKENIYNEIIKVSERATKASNIRDAIEIFTQLDGYKESKMYLERCKKRLRELENDEIYAEALQLLELETIKGCKKAIELFSEIPEWKNSSFKIDEANKKLIELQKKLEERKDKIAKYSMIGCACLILIGVILYLFFEFSLPKIKYSSAMKDITLGNYDEAYATLEELADYKDSLEQIKKSKYERAYRENYGEMTFDEKKISYELFSEAKDYLDAKTQMAKICETLSIDDQLKLVQVGDTVIYGRYEQDTKTESNELLRWIVAKKEGDKCLIVCQSAIEAKAFSTTTPVWSKSELREWLNGEFKDLYFVKTERDHFTDTTVFTEWYDENGNSKVDQSSDTIFILSEKEIIAYFPANSDRYALSTDYLESKGADVNAFKGWAHYWLRTPTENGGMKYVNGGGDISIFEKELDTEFGVRPAMWIK